MKLGDMRWKRTIAVFVFISLLASIVYAVVHIAMASPGAVADGPYEKLKSDYVLMLSQCILGIIVMFLPSLISRRLQFEIPGNMYLVFIIFLYCAIYLGEVRSFYYAVPQWDTILHTFSGGMLGALGFSVVSLLNNDTKVTMSMSPMFVAFFAFCFALALGALWEIYEFTFDGLMRLNMQKFALEDGTQLIGRAALSDTMKDLIVDALGALVVCIGGYFNIKKDKAWYKKIEFKKTGKR